jgi:predicted outer membrane protein
MMDRVLVVMLLVLMPNAQAQQDTEQAPPAAIAAPAPGIAGTPGGAQGISPELAEMTVGELAGRTLVNPAGDELGEVQEIARRSVDGELNAIVGVSGLLGFGERRIAVPLSEITFEEDRLITAIADSRGDLRRRGAPFDQDTFQTLTEQTRIADAATGPGRAGGAAPGGPPAVAGFRFEQLDADGDGYISPQEAQQHPELQNRWQRLDRNQDDRLDRAEFAGFEAPGDGQARPRDPIRNEEQLRQRPPMRSPDQMRQRDPSPP